MFKDLDLGSGRAKGVSGNAISPLVPDWVVP